jgi:hypothetical protein
MVVYCGSLTSAAQTPAFLIHLVSDYGLHRQHTGTDINYLILANLAVPLLPVGGVSGISLFG